MADFLTRLVARTLDMVPKVEPVVPPLVSSRFDQAEDGALGLVEDIDETTSAFQPPGSDARLMPPSVVLPPDPLTTPSARRTPRARNATYSSQTWSTTESAPPPAPEPEGSVQPVKTVPAPPSLAQTRSSLEGVQPSAQRRSTASPTVQVPEAVTPAGRTTPDLQTQPHVTAPPPLVDRVDLASQKSSATAPESFPVERQRSPDDAAQPAARIGPLESRDSAGLPEHPVVIPREDRPGVSPRLERVEPAPPVIRVTVGRVEVRATRSPEPRPQPARPRPTLSLDDYLKRRDGGER
jgi:hypothetical protein